MRLRESSISIGFWYGGDGCELRFPEYESIVCGTVFGHIHFDVRILFGNVCAGNRRAGRVLECTRDYVVEVRSRYAEQ